MVVLYNRIPIRDAREEGRCPSHDGEYLSLYWYGEEYIIEDNVGVVGTHIHNYVDCVVDAPNVSDEDIELAKEIQQEIDEIVEINRGSIAKNGLATGPLGSQARDIAKYWGWPINENGAYEVSDNGE